MYINCGFTKDLSFTVWWGSALVWTDLTIAGRPVFYKTSTNPWSPSSNLSCWQTFPRLCHQGSDCQGPASQHPSQDVGPHGGGLKKQGSITRPSPANSSSQTWLLQGTQVSLLRLRHCDKYFDGEAASSSNRGVSSSSIWVFCSWTVVALFKRWIGVPQ